MFFYRYQTAIGPVGIAEAECSITNLWFGTDLPRGFLSGSGKRPADERKTPLLAEAETQLRSYLSGALRSFDLPLSPEGTDFRQSVWRALLSITNGQTASYSDIAAAIGNPKGVRAVGLANNRNPIAILIPCHRVIGKDGSLTGYAGGLALKRHLLELEKTGYISRNS